MTSLTPMCVGRTSTIMHTCWLSAGMEPTPTRIYPWPSTSWHCPSPTQCTLLLSWAPGPVHSEVHNHTLQWSSFPKKWQAEGTLGVMAGGAMALNSSPVWQGESKGLDVRWPGDWSKGVFQDSNIMRPTWFGVGGSGFLDLRCETWAENPSQKERERENVGFTILHRKRNRMLG